MFNQGMSSFSSASVCNGTPLQEPSHSGTANRGGILGAGCCSVAGKRSCVAGVQQQWNLQPARLPQENYGGNYILNVAKRPFITNHCS